MDKDLKVFIKANKLVSLILVCLCFVAVIIEFILFAVYKEFFTEDICLYAIIGFLSLIYIFQVNKAMKLNKFKRTKVPTRRRLTMRLFVIIPMLVFILLSLLYILQAYGVEKSYRAEYINGAIMYLFLTGATVAVIVGVCYGLKFMYNKEEVAD